MGFFRASSIKCSATRTIFIIINNNNIIIIVGFGGLGVTCLPRGLRFAGSNPAEIFSGSKNPEHKSSGRDFKLGVPSLRFQAR